MSFVSSIGSSHPISEIETSHIYRLKKTRNEGDLKLHVFFNQESEDTVLYILSVRGLSGCSKVGNHEMYQK